MKLQQKTKKSLISLYFLIITTFLFSDTISFKANSMAGSIGENNTSTVLKGNAWIENEDLELFADEISLRGDNYDFITATGNISGRYKTSNFAFSCNYLEYDKNTGIVILKENVKIDDTENELSATASVVEYDKNLVVCIKPVGLDSEKQLPIELKNQLGGEIYTVHRLDMKELYLHKYFRQLLSCRKSVCIPWHCRPRTGSCCAGPSGRSAAGPARRQCGRRCAARRSGCRSGPADGPAAPGPFRRWWCERADPACRRRPRSGRGRRNR